MLQVLSKLYLKKFNPIFNIAPILILLYTESVLVTLSSVFHDVKSEIHILI